MTRQQHSVAEKSSTVGTRVTPSERELLAQRAAESGLSLSEWARSALLAAAHATPETRALMAEFLALRAVILTLHANAAQGKKYTPEMIEGLLAQADEAKFRLADQRLADALGAPLTLSVNDPEDRRERKSA